MILEVLWHCFSGFHILCASPAGICSCLSYSKRAQKGMSRKFFTFIISRNDRLGFFLRLTAWQDASSYGKLDTENTHKKYRLLESSRDEGNRSSPLVGGADGPLENID